MSFLTHLAKSWQSSMLCVGLDPDATRYPLTLQGDPDQVFVFCREIVDACAPFCAAFKPQFAYFAAQRAEPALERLCHYIRSHYSTHTLVLDAKRGDIGATASQYAVEAFERYGAHAVTVNPYMGRDSILPYLNSEEQGVFLLCRTSNAGGDELQNLRLTGGNSKESVPLFEHVAQLAQDSWNSNGQLGLVVGATYPEELRRVRQLAPTLPFLVPGIGAQGGDIQATVQAGHDANGRGMLISVSRSILYASSGKDFALAAAQLAQQTHNAILQALPK